MKRVKNYLSLFFVFNYIGRPKSTFDNLSERSKRRRTENVREMYNAHELAYAAEMNLRASGKRDSANKIKAAISESKSAESISTESALFTDDEALAMFVQAKLSKEQYIYIRQKLNEKNVHVLPSYHKIQEAKTRCYPKSMEVTESTARVSMQNLIDHCTERLIRELEDVLYTNTYSKVFLIFKWGFDSASGYSQYKMKASHSKHSDHSAILTCVVPLQLYAINQQIGRKIILWQNLRPSSTRLCLPLEIDFQKETASTIREKSIRICSEIEQLQPTSIIFSRINLPVIVKHELYQTMNDNKVVSALTNTGSQTCALCGVTPSKINNIKEILKLPVKTELYKYGTVVLHGWIRCMEYCLSIAYRLKCKKCGQRYTDDEKNDMSAIREDIQKQFRESELGLLIDMTKQGFGSTNDGNTARRFFQNLDLTSSITGLKKEFLESLKIILQTISCCYAIDSYAFRQFSLQTAQIAISEYGWYKMPMSIHKLLIHGADIIEALPIPIGLFSEEALESRHKDVKYYREHHTRKCSRKDGIRDIMNYLFISGDPRISMMRGLPPKKCNTSLSSDVYKLLKIPEEDDSHIFIAEYENDNEIL